VKYAPLRVKLPMRVKLTAEFQKWIATRTPQARAPVNAYPGNNLGGGTNG
jgi:hypothetical protein